MVRLGKKKSQALEMLQQLYGDNTISLVRGFKEEIKEVKDDTRMPSTSMTEVNVKQVRQVECRDCWLTVQMIASRLYMERENVKDYH